MKKVIAVLLCFVLLFCAPCSVFAEGNIIANNEELLEINIPERFNVITVQNMGSHQAYIEEKGTDAESLESSFKTRGIVACGYTQDRTQELFVAVTTNKAAKNIFSIDRFTQEEADSQLSAFQDPANEKAGIYVNSAAYVENGGIKFLRGSFENRYDPEAPVRVFQYYTLMNGRYYTVSLYDYAQTDFAVLGEQIDDIMKGFRFTSILQPEKERETQLASEKIIPVFIMAGLILGIIILVIIMRRSDKKRARAVQGSSKEKICD